MTLPASGNITLGNLITEFGGGTKLRDFFRGGTWVGDISSNAAIPTSGTIKLRDFLGANKAVTKITNRTILNDIGTTALSSRAGYRLNLSGAAEQRISSTYTTLETWLLSGLNSAYQCRATLQSGTTPTGTLNTWLAMSASNEWSITSSSVALVTSTLLIEIRYAATGVVIDNATITLQSQWSV